MEGDNGYVAHGQEISLSRDNPLWYPDNAGRNAGSGLPGKILMEFEKLMGAGHLETSFHFLGCG
jgi:hypothetical protein